jgi:hypothetical protein
MYGRSSLGLHPMPRDMLDESLALSVRQHPMSPSQRTRNYP